MLEAIQLKIQRVLFNQTQQQIFLEDISTLIEDGVPVSQAVDIIRQIYTGPTHLAANDIMQKIGEGKSIADGMENWFSRPIVEVIRAGEQGGTLPKTMKSAAEALAEEKSSLSSLIGSIIYPLTVIILALVVTVFIRHSVFVNFAQIKPVANWPTNGQLLYNLADFLQSWWWLVALIIILVVLATIRILRNLTGPVRYFIDTIPLLSLFRLANAARFMETLGLLISNGIVLKNALSILQKGANPYLSWHLLTMEYRLRGGKENIAEVLDTGLIKKDDILRLKATAKSKGFEHALIRLGKQALTRNAQTIQLTGRILGGILLGGAAAYAAFMIFSIYDVGSFVGS